MNEQEFYTRHLRVWLKSQDFFSTRVENLVQPGTPDVYYTKDGRSGWVETKIARAGRLHFEKFQLPWLSNHARCGGTAWVLATDETQLWLWRAEDVVRAPRGTYKKWTVVEVLDLAGPTAHSTSRPWAWREVLTALGANSVVLPEGGAV